MPFGSAAKSPKTQKLEDLQDRVLKLNALMAAGIERENQHQLDEAEKKQANASLSRKLKDATDTLAIVTASLATVSAVVQEVSATALFHDSVHDTGTSLISNSLPLGTYRSICLGPYGGPRGGGVLL